MSQIFNLHEQTTLRKKLRNNVTKGELVLWKHLKGSQLEFKFRRQCGIGKYVVDFYCPEIRLVIEIDGLSHNSEASYDQDKIRQDYLEKLGLLVKRYPSQDIFYKINEVLEDIYQTGLLLKRSHGDVTTP